MSGYSSESNYKTKVKEKASGFPRMIGSYLQHLFEYIGTQFPPPSSLLYGKMGSITLFFSNGNIKYDTTFYA